MATNPALNLKPVKPHPDFPLTPRKDGRWMKRIRGDLYYFRGTPEEALEKYHAALEEIDDCADDPLHWLRAKLLEPSQPTVYFLLRESNIVYVGMTTRFYSRVSNHTREGTKKFDQVYYIQLDDAAKLADLELALIVWLKPEYNVQSKDAIFSEWHLGVLSKFGVPRRLIEQLSEWADTKESERCTESQLQLFS